MNDANLIALGGDLTFGTGTVGTITASAGSSWTATGAMTLKRDVTISGAGTMSIKADSNGDETGLITCTADGSITMGAAVTLLELWAADIQLDSGCTIAGGNAANVIHIRPPCSACGMNIGFGSTYTFQLSDTELDAITTSGMNSFVSDAWIVQKEFCQVLSILETRAGPLTSIPLRLIQ